MMVDLSFLPKEGVSGTLYLYLNPQAPPVEHEDWSVLTWDGKQYHSHGNEKSLERLQAFADSLLWAKDWPQIRCTALERKINPCIRVEFEYKDGRTQRLTGQAAEDWMKDVNGVLAAQAIRYSQSQVRDHPWKFFRKEGA